MNVIFTCGGTGGHINPAIAAAEMWKEKHPGSKILFIGAEGGMEEQLVPKAGYELITLPGNGLSRSLSLKGIRQNVKVMCQLVSSVNRCKKLIREFDAEVVVGTGGYASFPALMAAALMKVPSCVHESNAVPGVTTKLAARWADKVLICFPQSAQYFGNQSKVCVVGMPVRSEFIYSDPKTCKAQLGLDERPVILSAFGSQGAKAMNEMTAELMRLEKNAGYPFQHIHATGSYGWEWMPKLVEEKGVALEGNDAIRLKEYLYDMPTVMAAADVVISRAGSSTCNEIAASGTPCILIPSPNVTANHQEKNARALEEQGAAAVILEADCSAEVVMEKIQKLLDDRETYQAMRRALLEISVPDSTQRLCAVMEELIAGKR